MNSPTALLPARKKYRNLAQGVVEELSARIRRSEFNPGDKLPPEAAIMEEYGVSRTVVREAISQLQAGGLVQTRHGIGTFVLEPPATTLGIGTDSVVTVRDVLAGLPSWSPEAVETALRGAAEAAGAGFGKLVQPLRLALTGTSVSPGIDVVVAHMGRDLVMHRIDDAIAHLEGGTNP